MNEQEQLNVVLDAVRPLLPDSVMATCENLNAHGEWEMALSHCVWHLRKKETVLSAEVKTLIEACEKRFSGSLTPPSSGR